MTQHAIDAATNHALFQSWRLGLFVHYAFYDVEREYPWGAPGVFPDGKTPSSLDELADGCDTEGIAALAADMQAEYCIFTAWHANMNPIYPSAVMDAWRLGHSARRDVIADLYDALDRHGIRLLLYIHPCDGHDFTANEQAALEWSDAPYYPRWNRFMCEMLSELAARYRGRVAGYWADGGLPPQIDHTISRLARALRDADPACILIQNEAFAPNYFRRWADYGCRERIDPPYHGTELQATQPICAEWWAKGSTPVWSPELAYQYTVLQAAVHRHAGGGFAVAVSPYIGGAWEAGVPEFARQLGRYVRDAGRSLRGTVPGRSFLTMPGTPLVGEGQPCWISTESVETGETFLHVLHPPAQSRLDLPVPKDDRRFCHANLLHDDSAVALTQDDCGVHLTLTASQSWQPLDTIIVLS